MKVLLTLAAVALAAPAAHAEGMTAVILIRRHDDAGRFLLGAGATTGDTQTLDLTLGYQVTDRVLVRLRERLWPSSSELEAGYALGVGKMRVPTDAIIRFKLFALAGGGITYEKEPTAHAGIAVHASILDWLSLELGARGTYRPTDESWVARSTTALPTSYARGVEVFASLAFLLPGPGYECVLR